MRSGRCIEDYVIDHIKVVPPWISAVQLLRQIAPAATLFFFLLSCLSISGCSLNSAPVPEHEIPIISTPQSPFSLQITDVQNDGKNLRVEGVISTKAPWYVDKVSVCLTGFRDGLEVASVARPLREFLSPAQISQSGVSNSIEANGPVLLEESPLAFSLILPSQNISDYQVTLGWGDDSATDHSRHVLWEEQSIVDLGADPVCLEADCPHIYAVEGVLRNDGQEVISAVTLTLKLQTASAENTSTTDTEDPEQIDLSPLNLLSGASQKVRLRFKNAISPELVGGIRAEVQIKSLR